MQILVTAAALLFILFPPARSLATGSGGSLAAGSHLGPKEGITLIYGSSGGLDGSGSQIFSADSEGISFEDSYHNGFGLVLAAGDFDGDGFTDLATGAYRQEINGKTEAGAVYVLYGTPTALTTAGNQVWYQDMEAIAGSSEEYDHFGSSLTAGDFDADGFTDLAVGIPYKDIAPLGEHDPIPDAGAVLVIYGSRSGLTSSRTHFWHQESFGVPDSAGADEYFGFALAAGDFDADGCEDLAVGVSGESVNYFKEGAVTVLFGSSAGVSAIGCQFWHQGIEGLPAMAEHWDGFGQSLSTGDYDGNGYADLAVGVPNEAVGNTPRAGAVSILYGGSGGLQASNSQHWYQGHPISGRPEENDMFGFLLTSADFDNDGFCELVIGVPHEDIGDTNQHENAGAVHLLFGSETGLTEENNRLLSQDSAFIYGTATSDNIFGQSLASGDLDGDGYPDLAIGIYRQEISGTADAGAISVLYGCESGLRDAMETWHADSPGVAGSVLHSRYFGRRLIYLPPNREIVLSPLFHLLLE
jgi:hypothetical protein